MPDDTDADENLYLTAIHHPARRPQLRAFRQFAEQEVESLYAELEAAPSDERDAYKKGRLDAFRLFHGMFAQAELALASGHLADGSPPTADEPPTCHNCGEVLGDEWVVADAQAKAENTHPADCPHCGENPLPPVG